MQALLPPDADWNQFTERDCNPPFSTVRLSRWTGACVQPAMEFILGNGLQ